MLHITYFIDKWRTEHKSDDSGRDPQVHGIFRAAASKGAAITHTWAFADSDCQAINDIF